MSLRAKLTFAAMLFAIAILGAAALGTYANLKRDLLAVSAQGQQHLAGKLAQDIASAIRLYEEALTQIAARLPENDMRSAQALERFLEQFPIGQTLFTRIVVFDPAGIYVSDLPRAEGARGKSFADREYLRAVMRERRPLVSAPLQARILDQPPIIVLSVPVIRGDRLVAVVSGYLNLRKADLLGPLLNYRIGETGYAMVVAGDGSYLSHPDKGQVLTRVQEPKLAAAIERLGAPAEREAHFRYGEDRGQVVSASLQRIASLGWTVIVAEPEDAVLAPAADTLRRAFAIGALLLALGVPLYFLVVTRLTRPLARLTSQVGQAVGTAAAAAEQIRVRSNDEIGSLADAFRATLARLQEKEAVLERSEELFRELGANLPEFIWVQDAETEDLLYLNAAWERITGRKVEPGGNMRSLFANVHPEDRERARLAAARAPLGGFDEILRFVTADGAERWIHARSFPIRNTAGDVYRVAGLGQDITERMQAAEAMRMSTERLEQAQHIGKLGYLDWDLATNELALSEETIAMYRLDKEKKVHTLEEITGLLHPEDRERVEMSLRAAIAGGAKHDMEHRMVCPDGTEVHVRATAELIRDHEGKPVRMLGTNLDITERKRAEERLRASLREKETLLREIHHRVKNNLQIISSLLHFQSRKAKSPEDLAVFQEGRHRLKSMILVHEKLYQSQNLSRIEFGDYARELVQEVGAAYRDSAKGVELKVEAGAVYLPIEVALPLGMLLSELVTNVFKYAYPAGQGGTLRVTVAGADGKLELVVADDGVGLPAGVDPGAPESFGMQLVANLAEQLGAKVRYERGAGLRVEVSVPLEIPGHGDEQRAA